MTVKELKEELEKYPDDMPVSFDVAENGSECEEYFIDATYTRVSEHSGKFTLFLYQE